MKRVSSHLIIAAAEAVAAADDPLIKGCGNNCNRTLVIAAPLLAHMGYSVREIARAMGVNPKYVHQEIAHFSEAIHSDPHLKRKTRLAINNLKLQGIIVPPLFSTTK